jgi:hypothetical protein
MATTPPDRLQAVEPEGAAEGLNNCIIRQAADSKPNSGRFNAVHNPTPYLAGRIAVTVVPVTTDDQEFSTDTFNLVLGEIQEGLMGPADSGPDLAVAEFYNTKFNCGLEFSVHQAETEYLGSNPMGMTANEIIDSVEQIASRWGSEEGSSAVEAFNRTQLQSQGSDWAFTVFILNDVDDKDGRLADGRFAFVPHPSAPYMVLTARGGPWGISRLNRVFVHELHHIFGALDEYRGSGVPADAQSGYLRVPNSNAQTESPEHDYVCISRDPEAGAICPFTLGQVGVRAPSSPADSVPDAIQFAPGGGKHENQVSIQVDGWREYDADGDSIPEPGESGDLLLSIVNNTPVLMRNLELEIVSTIGGSESTRLHLPIGHIPAMSRTSDPNVTGIEITLDDTLTDDDAILISTTMRTSRGWTFEHSVTLNVSESVESAVVESVNSRSWDEWDWGEGPIDNNALGVASGAEEDLMPDAGCGGFGVLSLLGFLGPAMLQKGKHDAR